MQSGTKKFVLPSSSNQLMIPYYNIVLVHLNAQLLKNSIFCSNKARFRKDQPNTHALDVKFPQQIHYLKFRLH